MAIGLTWEDQTRTRIERAKVHLKHAEEAQQHWSSRVKALEDALRLETATLAPSIPTEVQKPDFLSMSLNDALIRIANENGGLLVTRRAIQRLHTVGLFPTNAEANDAVHTTLRRSKDFRKDKEVRGVYHLISTAERVNGSDRDASKEQPSVASRAKLTDVIGLLVIEHPAWQYKEVLTQVVASGYDFQGKNPGLAVNMALQRVKREAEKVLHTVSTVPVQEPRQESPIDKPQLRLVASG